MKITHMFNIVFAISFTTLGLCLAVGSTSDLSKQSLRSASLSGAKRSWYESQGMDNKVSRTTETGQDQIQCNNKNLVGLESAAFTALATKFCKDSTLDASTSKDVTPADAGIKHYEGYKFSFQWEKAEGICSTSCIDMFSAFLSSSVCSYDHHTKAASGSNKLPCGTASFAFNNGKILAPLTPAIRPQSSRSGCQSPNHSAPRASFKLAQSDKAVWMWNEHNCLLDFSMDGRQGCTLFFNPCSKKFRERAVSVALTITMLSGNGSAKPTYEDSRDTFYSVVSDCDTTTVDEKWGGWRTIERGGAVWMYNVTADQTGNYAPASSKHKAVQVTSGPYCNKSWLSGR